jgi:hypothetical protein
MGLDQDTSYTSILKTIVCPYPCNFNGIQSLNILIENLNTENLDSLSKSNSTVVQSIPIDFTLQQISFNKTNNFSFLVKQDVIGLIQIDIRDDLENLINLNNQHWNMTLQFKDLVNVNRFTSYNNFHTILGTTIK